MNEDTEIIIFAIIVVGISILLLLIYIFPKKSYYIEQPKSNNLTENDLNIYINQTFNEYLNKNFNNQLEKIDQESKESLKPYIKLYLDCFTQKIINYYKKNNVFDISEIIKDLKENNLPINFNSFCKSNVINSISYLQSKLGTSFKINDVIKYVTKPGSPYLSNSLIDISIPGQIYNFSQKQLDYLDKYITITKK
jgi:hypothetical protein